MKIRRNIEELIINILSLLLIILSFIMLLLIIAYYQIHSPEYLTHEQFYIAIAGVGFSFFAGLLGVWLNVSNKITHFAEVLGELKGRLNQFLDEELRKRRRK